MESPIELIHRFNVEAGLLEKGYDDFLESSFQIEEALEGFENNFQDLAFELQLDKKYSSDVNEVCHAKHLARHIVGIVSEKLVVSDVDRLDKACDSVVFAVGSMAKLGLSPEQITRALNIVMHANFSKLAMPKDSFGKLMKPENFAGPEDKLQEILNER